ncbi:MAG: DEAD/DEAH box helicase [Candidatus Eremiobacteraeota bacterium]|nr:DEAD/DEAH box helicase [Candidatus Eremiobacteraeota bacterium]
MDAGSLRLADDDERRWIDFIGATVPQLRAEGWRVEIDDEFPYVILDTEDEWHADLTETGARWFELELGIDVGGERVTLLPVLIDALSHYGVRSGDDLTQLAARSEPIFGRLPSGAYVALPPARVARALAALVDLFDGSERLTEEGRLPIAPLHAAALSTLDGKLRVQWKQTEWLPRLFEELSHVESRDVHLPPEFKAELRPYQRHGVAWLQTLSAHGFGGVLADDMGLGKTVQFLAHAAIEKMAGRLRAPVLIVAPTSVVPNWRAEIARFVPSLRVIALTGSDRAKDFAKIVDADIVLTTYALLPKDAEHLLDRPWSIAVLDEAQVVKNPRTKAALVASKLRAKQCVALTGTPIENHLEDLWSIYAFAVPGLLGHRAQFSRVFRTPIEKHNDVLRRSALAARLRPFLLRRTKEVVARDLPPKSEIVQRVELTGAQRDLYETIRLAMHKRVRDEVARRGLGRSRILLLDALLKLRQVCCDPRLLKLPAAQGVKESQKLDALLEMLDSLIDDGRRILLFSQFTSMLDLMKPELTSRKYPFLELRGDTRDRETPVKRFQSGDIPLFLISLKAGGTGLNLTAADTVIHYDPWWNPAVERQATDRAHRIGQEQHVFVYKLIAEGTVEERILELQERKGALASGLFDETSAAPLRLEFEDIERLFM